MEGLLYQAFEVNLGKIAGFGRRTILAHQAGDENDECPSGEQSGAGCTPLPLPALLSQVLVAFVSSVPKPEGFPHYPMLVHRGGFPDGS